MLAEFILYETYSQNGKQMFLEHTIGTEEQYKIGKVLVTLFPLDDLKSLTCS